MADEKSSQKWVEIYATTSEYEARIIKGLLESEGIFCLLRSSRVAQFPFDIGQLGEVKIMVPMTEVETGKQILQDYLTDRTE
ncbi:MAG: DUF2007 domain-containing protein [bacterium]